MDGHGAVWQEPEYTLPVPVTEIVQCCTVHGELCAGRRPTDTPITQEPGTSIATTLSTTIATQDGYSLRSQRVGAVTTPQPLHAPQTPRSC